MVDIVATTVGSVEFKHEAGANKLKYIKAT